jgi:hypothetical protein
MADLAKLTSLKTGGTEVTAQPLITIWRCSLTESPVARPTVRDSEGTMGGLVRMGRPEHLARVVAQALEDASWCSADPVRCASNLGVSVIPSL